MNDEEQSWIELRIGITDEDAINFLEDLANNKAGIRDEIQENPGEVFRKKKIDFLPGTEPKQVRLPERDEIMSVVSWLRERAARGEPCPISHGFLVLVVSHGISHGPPPPPPPPEP